MLNRRTVMRFLALAIPVVIAMGAVSPAFQVSAPASATEPQQDADAAWPEPYAYLHAGFAAENMKAALAKLPYDRIQLQRTACFGACPDYTVTLGRDGSAEYEGRRAAPRHGKFKGEVNPFEYGRLCCLLESQGLENLEREYSAPWTDAATTYVRIWRETSDQPTEVKDYGSFGPIALWGMQEAIDGVADRIAWKPAPK